MLGKVATFLITASNFHYSYILPQVFFMDTATENQGPAFPLVEPWPQMICIVI